MNTAPVSELLAAQRTFFNSHKTRSVQFRLDQLKALRATLVKHEAEIFAALKADLGKPAMEAYTTEFGFVLSDLDHTVKNLKKWTRPRRVSTPPVLFPASSQVMHDPKGVVLIIGAWNYPIQLTFAPLIAALAAGNCAIVKPSEVSEHGSRLVSTLIKQAFSPDVVTCVEGGVDVTTELLEQPFDHIFFTGSPQIGRIVYAAAAKHLTPVTLELGGKSPCIIDSSARLDVAARRIAFGKFTNAGQTCVAPDYLLVEKGVKERFLETFRKTLVEFYGADARQSPDFGRIINARHFQRLVSQLGEGEIVIGGGFDEDTRYIAPTVLQNCSADGRLMNDEIFGPLLPVVEYSELGEAIAHINARPHPLAMYVFSENTAHVDRILNETTCGGGCVNDTIVHLGVHELPFGGTGNSGIGAYHGQHGFTTFSHQKSVLKNPTALDVKLRYPPYRDNLKLIRKLM